MSIPFDRTVDSIRVDLNREIRRYISGLAASVPQVTSVGTHPFAHRLAAPITVSIDQDDAFLFLARSDVIATAAQIAESTAFAEELTLDEAEAWFDTLQVGCQALAGSLRVTIPQDLDRLDPDDRVRLRLAQDLLSLLVEILDEPVCEDEL
ncbi:MAG: hypothetical protein WCL38_04605 [Actinomycetota bacterium]